MKHTIYYSNYIDLFKSIGVGTSIVETEQSMIYDFAFCQSTTINQLNVYALILGLKRIPRGDDVHVVGCSRYLGEALKRLSQWIKSDELDVKSHSHLWKEVWRLIRQLGEVTYKTHGSRRGHEILYPASQLSAQQFRHMQLNAIKNLGFPKIDYQEWLFNHEMHPTGVGLDDFLNHSFDKPLTEAKFEKLIQARFEDEDHEKKPALTLVK